MNSLHALIALAPILAANASEAIAQMSEPRSERRVSQSAPITRTVSASVIVVQATRIRVPQSMTRRESRPVLAKPDTEPLRPAATRSIRIDQEAGVIVTSLDLN